MSNREVAMRSLKAYFVFVYVIALAFMLASCGNVSDGNGGNTPPGVDPGPDQNVFAGSLVTLDGGGSWDADGDLLTYSWSFVSVPNGSTAALSDATAVNPTFTADLEGVYVVSLAVSDGRSSSPSASVTITASSSAPIANAGPDRNVALGSLVNLNGSDSSDPNGDMLTYSWFLVSVPGGSTAALSGATTVNPTFTADIAGSYVVQLIVNDGTADSAPDTVTVSVSTTPVADAGQDQNAATGSLVILHGGASYDPDNDYLIYSWSFTSVPSGSGATLAGATTANPTFTPDQVGSYVIRLVVSDGTSDSAPDTVTVSVSTAPVADAGPDQNAAPNSLVTLDGSASYDPDGDAFTYKWTGSAVLSDSTAAKPTFTPTVNGYYSFQLIVNDGTVNSAPDTVRVFVSTTPMANAGPDKNYTNGAVVTLDGSGSFDPYNNPLTYSWSLTSVPGGSTAALSGSTTVDPTFTADLEGIYVAALTVNNTVQDSDPDTVTITVLTPGAPTALLPDTGLTKCYDTEGTEIGCTGTGQDGEFSINPMSFTDNGNGTITDDVTGLMWQKCRAGLNNDADCSGTASTYNWYEAAGIYNATSNPSATDVCGDLSLGGHTDWRLPNEMELMTIVDYGRIYPAIDTTYFPNASEPFSLAPYWSSSSISYAYLPFKEYAWFVDFGIGFVNTKEKTDTEYIFYARCVRGTSPAPSFTDNGDGTVIDLNTGLIWQQQDGGASGTWQEALDYCNTLNLAGYADWRLPNIKELRSIVDSSTFPAINTAYFKGTEYSYGGYWSSTIVWGVGFTDGAAGQGSPELSGYARCVR